jgi:uncharacterized protein YgiM (DUF1202 family)
MRQAISGFLLLLFLPLAAWAETLYIIDKIYIGMRADLTEGSKVVKTVETGAALEVLERFEKFVRVRDPEGMEGWIDSRYLVPEPPARLGLDKLRSELLTVQAQLGETQAQLKKAEAAAVDAKGKIKELEQLNATHQAEGEAVAAASAPEQSGGAPTDGPTADIDGAPSFTLLLVISFAMLVIGFVAGNFWLKESIKKRSGGMYLRV